MRCFGPSQLVKCSVQSVVSGFESDLRQLIFLTALGVLCCFAILFI